MKKALSSFVGIAMLMMTGAPLHAEIYKWTDENGKVRFSNNSGEAKKQGSAVESVAVSDPYAVKVVAAADPIIYEGNSPSRPLSLSQMSLEIPGSDGRNVSIGSVTLGATCSQAKSLFWDEGYVSLDDKIVQDGLVNVFVRAGYLIENLSKGAPSVPGGYILSGKITRLRVNICFPAEKVKRSKSDVYVRIRWELRDPVKEEVVYSQETEGSYNGFSAEPDVPEKEYPRSFSKAISVSANNLLATQTFVDMLKPADNSVQVSKWKELMPVDVVYGDGGSLFKSQVEVLKATSVTVHTPNGHGSGVIISNEGYILTNAHVVGDLQKVDVLLLGGQSVSSDVQRIDTIRDVALLHLPSNFANQAALISSTKPQEGGELYVIGTPLSESLGHTITKGVFSANRKMSGQDYYQTDAAINPGNSGGPVFNEHGELIGISVAGMFTQGGAGLNINYAIPIEDALKALGIEPKPDLSVKAQRFVSGFRIDEHAYPRLHTWIEQLKTLWGR